MGLQKPMKQTRFCVFTVGQEGKDVDIYLGCLRGD